MNNQNENYKEPDPFSWRTMAFTAFGFLTAGEAAQFSNAISLGYVNAALIHGAIAALMLNTTHGILKEEWQMKDDDKATGLKNHFIGFAAGSIMAVMSPNPYEEIGNAQQEQVSAHTIPVIEERIDENSVYPALANVSFH